MDAGVTTPRPHRLDRMHRRRERGMGTGYGGSSGYAPKRSYTGTSWRPSAFKLS